ncbi:MAG TPA: hypothetical protein VGS21_00385, partial [Acidimicrobiales bacterium]|nr:hypothetical protein [Acidimicrobiales bacterium]
APSWTSWLFAMMGARFIGYGVGMLATARDPVGHRMWLDTMIAIQAVDWIATIAYLAAGDVSLHQVAAASFMPAVFVVALLSSRPRRSAVLSAA